MHFCESSILLRCILYQLLHFCFLSYFWITLYIAVWRSRIWSWNFMIRENKPLLGAASNITGGLHMPKCSYRSKVCFCNNSLTTYWLRKHNSKENNTYMSHNLISIIIWSSRHLQSRLPTPLKITICPKQSKKSQNTTTLVRCIKVTRLKYSLKLMERCK